MNKDHIAIVVQNYEKMNVTTKTQYRKWLLITAMSHVAGIDDNENSTYARDTHTANLLDILDVFRNILGDTRYNDVIWEILGMMEYGDYEEPEDYLYD